MITSRQNVWFQRVRNAIRDHADEIVIEGPKAVSDALAAGWTAIAVVSMASGVPTDATAASPVAPASGVPHDIQISAALFDQLSETKTSQGVLALFQRPRTTPDQLFSRRDAVVVALDGVQDPGNVGTIVRLAAAFDAAGVALLPGCADPFGPKAIRASAGAILTVPVANVTQAELFATRLPLVAAAGDGLPVDPPARAAILVFGSEGAGVSPELRARATAIAVATSGRVESLNVAASAAILLSRAFSLR
jgi:TrmH family RNA methyltransferase